MSETKSRLSLIVAWAANRCIGLNNRLPWQATEGVPAELAKALREFGRADMRHFRRMTLNKPVIMGYRTWLSIGKPLAGRHNIILSRQSRQLPAGCQLCASRQEAIGAAEKWNRHNNQEEIMVIGGAQVYSEFINYAQRIYVTELDKELEGNAFFPHYEASMWSKDNESKQTYNNNLIALFFQLDNSCDLRALSDELK